MKKSSVETHFDEVAKDYDYYKKNNKYYYDNLKKLLKSLIPQNKKVFEVGCGTGDLLATLKPKKGYGMDLSSGMIQLAKSKYKKSKNLKFSTTWPLRYYDYIYMSDVIEHLENPKGVFEKISKLMDSDAIFICTMANPIWEPLLMFWERMGWKMPEGKHYRMTFDEIDQILKKVGLTVTKHNYRLLIPVNIPFLSKLANKYLEKFFQKYAFIEYFVAKKNK